MILIFLALTVDLKAQADTTLLKILKTTLYDDKVYSKVFFEYNGMGKDPFVLQKGTYAFIYPDSVFCQAYPDIVYDLSLTMATEQKFFTLTYIKDKLGTVFVKSSGDNNVRFQILFDEIRISDNEARIRFKTSCECQGNEIGTIHFFDADLVFRENNWKIINLIARDVYGCKPTYLGKPMKGN